MSNHFEEVKRIVVDKLQVDEKQVTMEASFIEDLGADSLDTVELVMDLEEHFGIEIPDEDAEKLKTVKDAVDYIASNVSRLREMSPLWEMAQEGIDIKSIQWAEH